MALSRFSYEQVGESLVGLAKLGKEVGSLAWDISTKADPRGAVADNLWTGRKGKLWPGIVAAGVGITLGMNKGKTEDRISGKRDILFDDVLFMRRPAPGPQGPQDFREAPMMLADGRGAPRPEQARTMQSTQANNLGASGSMVFGMHNAQHGGYL